MSAPTSDGIIINRPRYHSHFELQRSDGLYGGLIVHEPLENGASEISNPSYDDEILLMIGDWYHRVSEEVRASYVTHDSWGREVCYVHVSLLDLRANQLMKSASS